MKGLSLRTKVFFLFAGASLAIVVPALILIARAVEGGVYERAQGELVDARTSLERSWQTQGEALLETARRLALEPTVVEAFTTQDSAALSATLAQRVEAARIVLAGDSLGEHLVGPTLRPGTRLDQLARVSVVVPADSALPPMRAVVRPVETAEGVRVGWVGVGRALDAAALSDLKLSSLGTDVALVVGDSLLGTTLADSLDTHLRQMDLSRVLGTQGRWRRFLANYLFAVQPLETGTTRAAVLFFRPVANELRIVNGIRGSLYAIGFLALIMALFLAVLVSRIVARPARRLAEASAHLAKGDFRAPLPPASGDEIGQLTRAFGEMRSALAKREARLRSAQTELIHREKLAAMGRLVAQLSHEINNPIYNIQNCLEALERRGSPTDPNREFLELAQEELGRMAKLTRQLLDQSRPLSDAAAPLDLNATARRVTTLAASQLAARDISVQLSLDPRLPSVVAHPDAIQQVLANLVENAIDAMPEGGTLTITSTHEPGAIELRVEDTGVGVPEEHLPHIFDAFYSTKPQVRGTGLGLFVSEGIVRGHRGRLSVERTDGGGSRFVIRLPRETLDTESVTNGEPSIMHGVGA